MAGKWDRLRLPGFGLPVDYYKDYDGFPSAFKGWGSQGVTVREQRMLAFIGDVTDSPGWERSVFDQGAVDGWRASAGARPVELKGDVVLSEKMLDYCIRELRDKAAIFKETGLVSVLDGEIAVVKSDVAISDTLRDALCQAVKPLEDVPDRLKDWRRQSDGLILDLLDPSLFPLAYGLTKVTPDEEVPLDGCAGYSGKGIPTDAFTPPIHDRSEWISFQWLPTDVQLTDAGAKLDGYINNLHPEAHRELYGVLEEVLTAAVPLWEECLSGYRDHRRIWIDGADDRDWTFPEGLEYRIPDDDRPPAFYNPSEDTIHDEQGADVSRDHEDWLKRWDQDYEDYKDWERERRVLTQREPDEYKSQAELREPAGEPAVSFREYADGLQVIFQLSSIHLSPEKPSYEGTPWQVAGGLNESVCATVTYYFHDENVTDGHVALWQSVNGDAVTAMIRSYNDEWESTEAYFGISRDGPVEQELGKALAREERLLVFPNCVQHQARPFSLRDRTRPGHRKILTMFLVDPERALLSTSYVPPQRRDWWAAELDRRGALRGLPAELAAQVVGLVDGFPISWERAAEMRSANVRLSNRLSLP